MVKKEELKFQYLKVVLKMLNLFLGKTLLFQELTLVTLSVFQFKNIRLNIGVARV